MSVLTTTEKTKNKIHPKMFALWLSCASITMMFAAFTSAYIVRKAAGNWFEFAMPSMFYVSTIVILLSSLTLHGAYHFYLKGVTQWYRSLLVATLMLGIAFVATQYFGWLEMFSQGVDLKGNPSGPFVYVISGVHALHVLGGITALVIACIHAFGLPHKVTEARKLRFKMTFTYWHFVDLLWIYLLIFLMNQ